jgi:hypothetical protein
MRGLVTDTVLVMDPKSGQFTEFSLPEGWLVTLLAERPGGGARVASELMERASGRSWNWAANGREEICSRCWREDRERFGWAAPPEADSMQRAPVRQTVGSGDRGHLLTAAAEDSTGDALLIGVRNAIV